LVRVRSASSLGLFAPKQRSSAFGSLCICCGACPAATDTIDGSHTAFIARPVAVATFVRQALR
jgi:hypothetical protein